MTMPFRGEYAYALRARSDQRVSIASILSAMVISSNGSVTSIVFKMIMKRLRSRESGSGWAVKCTSCDNFDR